VEPGQSGWQGGAAASPEGAAPSPEEAALEAEYGRRLDAWMPGMGHEILVERQESQQALERLCHELGAPGESNRRAALCRAMIARLGPPTPLPARVWMLRKLEPLSHEESVPVLVSLLSDDEPLVRETARRALQNNPAEAAAKALRTELARATDVERKVALINALGARRDGASVPMLVPLARSGPDPAALAAIAALADIGTPEAIDAVLALREHPLPQLHDAVADASLRCAERLVAAGQSARAVGVYEACFATQDPTARIAALRGLLVAQGEQVLPRLLQLVAGDDPQMRAVAAGYAMELTGENVTQRLAAAAAESSPEVQVMLLDVLAARGDAQAWETVARACQAAQPPVREAALAAAGRVGDVRAVPILLSAAGRTGPEREIARHSLAVLRGPGVDRVLLAGMAEGEPGQQAEAIRALAARQTSEAIPRFLDAAADAAEPVRVAALESLAGMAGAAELPRLVDVLVQAADVGTRGAAEQAIVATSRRIDDPSRTTGVVLRLWPEATAPARASLIRVMGAIQGTEALGAVRIGLRDPEVEVQDAAVRALAEWNEPVVLEDLEEIAAAAPSETQRVLALRGYVRLVRASAVATSAPARKESAEVLALLQRGMELADRPESKKLVLAGLGDVVSMDAVKMALPYLHDQVLGAEAAAAVLEITPALSIEHYEEATAAIEEARSAVPREAIAQRTAEALEKVSHFRGYCTTWQVVGPFMQEGKKGNELLDVAFPPEQAEDQTAWSSAGRLAVTDAKNPWAFDLLQLGDPPNCCAYVRTKVWSDAQQPAALQIGSDDGVAVWLNGQSVFRHDAARPLTCGEDTAGVTLNQGWNTLLLKITQGGGGWGVCCGVRAPGGEPIEGLRFSIE